ncbi:MAG: lysylphosphatidylglycerol synthase transmembrane domain-containing protein [Bacteroidia bacterium]
MNPRIKFLLQLVLFGSIGISLVWLSIHNIPDSEIETTWQSFKNANYFVVLLSTFVSILAHIVRSWRWNSLLQPLGHNISFKNSFASVMVGSLVGYVVPRGGGDLIRCGIATRYEKVPFTAALGTLVTERIVDFLLLLTLFFITFALQFKELIGLTNLYVFTPLAKNFSTNQNLFYILVTTWTLLILALIVFRKKIKKILKGNAGDLLQNFGNGIKSIKDVKNLKLFILQSVAIWLFYFLTLYICFGCFHETKTLGLKPALSLLLFSTIGGIVSPGGIGAYQMISTQVLLYYGVMGSVSFSFPWIAWGLQFIAVILIGGLCFLLLPILNRDKLETTQQSI